MASTMEVLKSVTDDIEKFIHDLDTANIVIKDKANDVKVFLVGKGIMGRETRKPLAPLNSILAIAIADYKAHKDRPLLYWRYLMDLSTVIEFARTHNVIEYPNLAAKAERFDELEKEHEKLKSDHAKIMKAYNTLAKENEKLEKENRILHGFDKKHRHRDEGLESGGLHRT